MAAATQYEMLDITILPVFAVSNPATEDEENNPGWSTSETSGSQYNT